MISETVFGVNGRGVNCYAKILTFGNLDDGQSDEK